MATKKELIVLLRKIAKEDSSEAMPESLQIEIENAIYQSEVFNG